MLHHIQIIFELTFLSGCREDADGVRAGVRFGCPSVSVSVKPWDIFIETSGDLPAVLVAIKCDIFLTPSGFWVSTYQRFAEMYIANICFGEWV